MKMIQFVVPKGLPQQKLSHYLQINYPEIPAYCIKNAFQSRDIKIDGLRCGKDAVVHEGNQVTMYLPEDKVKRIPILYQSDEILIIHKPSGIPCESCVPGERTIADLLENQIKKKVWLCHRLDAPTEGLLVLALSEQSQAKMQDVFKCRGIDKEYICLVAGRMEKSHEVLKAWLIKDPIHHEVHLVHEPRSEAKQIITEYWVIESSEISRLRVKLYTGRTHQIRAHLASIGHPVLGDDRYGNRNINKQQKMTKLKLCSVSLYFHTEGRFPELDGKTFETSPSF